MKIKSLPELFDAISEEERIIVDVLRAIILEFGKGAIKEKISYNVPYFFRNHGICIVWPSSIPRGGISEGVLLGFWYGNMLKDEDGYLSHGTNKQIFYRIFTSADDIDVDAIRKLLSEALLYDEVKKKKTLRRK